VIQPDLPSERIVVVCRNPGRRAAVERLAAPAETHASAMEAVLAVARRPAQAVVVNLEDVEGAEREVLAALRHARPGVIIYALVRPEDEPLGRRLLREGASDYFVYPGDVNRLPAVLHPQPDARADAGARAAAREDMTRDSRRGLGHGGLEVGGHDAHFACACELADLAMAQPLPLFCDGAASVARAIGARQGSAFVASAETGRLELAATLGDARHADRTGLEVERAAAERVLRTGTALCVPADHPGAPPGGLLCVPVREGETTFGVVCLTARADGTPFSPNDEHAAAPLAGVLGRLYRSALQREQYARLALRDVETGLLKADPLLVYLESLIERARDARSDLALALLAADDDAPADALARTGRTILGLLGKGWQAGRLDAGTFAIVIPRTPPDAPGAQGSPDTYFHDAVRALTAALSRADDALALRVSVASYPRDGTAARALLASAESRLATG
jgi:GGDEF domain-containing protein